MFNYLMAPLLTNNWLLRRLRVCPNVSKKKRPAYSRPSSHTVMPFYGGLNKFLFELAV